MLVCEKIGGGFIRYSRLFIAAALIIDVAVDRIGCIRVSPTAEVKEALTLHRQLESALCANCLTRIRLVRERSIGAHSISSPGNRSIIDRDGNARVVRALRIRFFYRR